MAADADAALDALRPRLRDGDVVLVKASRGIGLDHLVDALRLEIGEAAGRPSSPQPPPSPRCPSS